MAVLVGKGRLKLYRKLGWAPDNWQTWKLRTEGVILFVLSFFVLTAGIALSVPANNFLDGLRTLLDSLVLK
jgi:hypothetical protein